MNKAIIIIPHYNRWDLTHARLFELYQHERDNIDHVLVVDNGSTDENTEGGLHWWSAFRTQKNFDVRAKRLDKNIGFLKACNFGLREVSATVSPDTPIILLSNDVIMHGKFIDQILESLSANKKSLIGGSLLIDTGWNQVDDKFFPYLEGWLLATTAESWSLLGGFDERYAPHVFEDVDLSTNAKQMGFELVPLNNVNLNHLVGQTITYNKEREELTRINQEKFRKKWIKDE